MNIVTSLAVDTNAEDAGAHYPQIAYFRPRQRRELYWQCAAVFFATATRAESGQTRILFTNDREPATVDRVDVRAFLRDLGVEVRYLPFQKFKAPLELSRNFRNAFYKLEVVSELASLSDASVLLDVDCVWLRPEPAIEKAMELGKLLLLDISDTSGGFRREDGIDRAEMRRVFQALDSEFSNGVVRWFGGEIVGGAASMLRPVAEALEDAFGRVCRYERPMELVMNGKQRFLDNDEFISSFVYNRLDVPYEDARAFMRRIWTVQGGAVAESDLDLAIWHFPAEKQLGFRTLFQECCRGDRAFWSVPAPEFAGYLGARFGVPRRLVFPPKGIAERIGRTGIEGLKAIMPATWYDLARRIAKRRPGAGGR